MTILTKTAVQEALDKAIEARGPDYVYTNSEEYDGECQYATGREGAFAPSCVVGFVVDAIDHDAFEKLAQEEALWGSFSASEIGGRELDIEPEDSVVADALQLTQEAQDEGLSWGEAREFAVRLLGGESYFNVRRDLTDAIKAANGYV